MKTGLIIEADLTNKGLDNIAINRICVHNEISAEFISETISKLEKTVYVASKSTIYLNPTEKKLIIDNNNGISPKSGIKN